jgi:hypothetical protein
MIEEIRQDVKDILKILNGNGAIGVVAQTEINKQDIVELKKRPNNIKNWIVAAAIIINALVAAGAIWRTL